MGFVFERVGGIGKEEGHSDHIKVFECDRIVFFGLFLGLGEDLFVFEGDAVGD